MASMMSGGLVDSRPFVCSCLVPTISPWSPSYALVIPLALECHIAPTRCSYAANHMNLPCPALILGMDGAAVTWQQLHSLLDKEQLLSESCISVVSGRRWLCGSGRRRRQLYTRRRSNNNVTHINSLGADFVFCVFKTGETDVSYLAPDCFHLSQKAQSQLARMLWNNMVASFMYFTPSSVTSSDVCVTYVDFIAVFIDFSVLFFTNWKMFTSCCWWISYSYYGFLYSESPSMSQRGVL